jgi:hypothetical protein
MAVSTQEFRSWLCQESLPHTVAGISSATGLARTTVHHQLARGRVGETTVVALARACGVDPIYALGSFESYRDLPAGLREPSPAEVLSQVSSVDVLAEVLARDTGDGGPAVDTERELRGFPHAESVRMWVEAIDPGGLRKHVSEATGISISNLSTQISQNRFTPASALHAARFAGVSLANGLVMTGILTPAEASWHPTAREDALKELPDLELLLMAEARIYTLRRRAHRRSAAN